MLTIWMVSLAVGASAAVVLFIGMILNDPSPSEREERKDLPRRLGRLKRTGAPAKNIERLQQRLEDLNYIHALQIRKKDRFCSAFFICIVVVGTSVIGAVVTLIVRWIHK